MTDDYNFDEIPLFDGTTDSFKLMVDRVSGRIPVTRLEHWRDLQELLDSEYFKRGRNEYVYRGHRRFDWTLQPTLARVSDNGVIESELSENHLKAFRQAIRGRVSDYELVRDHEIDELWAVGQHHGLMTPLLDWTYSPFGALFFAFAGKDVPGEKDNPYRSVYLLNKTYLHDNNCLEIPLVEPMKDDYGRLVNQAGLFTKSPEGDTFENVLINWLAEEDNDSSELANASENEQAAVIAKYICKVYIPNNEQADCVRFLRRMNVHHASLFPDLIGAAQHCNTLAYEKFIDEKENDENAISNEESIIVERDKSPEEIISHGSEEVSSGLKKNQGHGSPVLTIPSVAFIGIILHRFSRNLVSIDLLELAAKKVMEIYMDEISQAIDVRGAEVGRFRKRVRWLLRRYGYPIEGINKASNEILISQGVELESFLPSAVIDDQGPDNV
jgi:hypothetical protein